MARVTIRLDPAAVKRVVGSAADAAALQAANVTAARAKRNIQKLGRIDSSAMYRGMTVSRASAAPLYPSYYVYTPVPYAIFQEVGTGLYGPFRRPITPKHAKALRFRPKGAQGYVFAKSVRGVKPGRFMHDAIQALSVRDFLIRPVP